MDLDWCADENLSNAAKFNENSIIDKEKKKISNTDKEQEKINNDINIENCFDMDLNIINSKNLLSILNYLSLISNYLRTFIRNKSTKFNEFTEITLKEFELINKYLIWLHDACNVTKKYFSVPLRRDNSYDPNNIKLFKTSSYKFCNFKETCSIHKNKNKCDKNHFVFDMIINDISKLIESVKIVGIDNINWIMSNKIVKVTYFNEEKKYIIENISNINLVGDLNENQFIIDKTLIFKSFDVISYVLNKMYDESYCFINYDLESFLINLDF
jgi:hypothetical protein